MSTPGLHRPRRATGKNHPKEHLQKPISSSRWTHQLPVADATSMPSLNCRTSLLPRSEETPGPVVPPLVQRVERSAWVFYPWLGCSQEPKWLQLGPRIDTAYNLSWLVVNSSPKCRLWLRNGDLFRMGDMFSDVSGKWPNLSQHQFSFICYLVSIIAFTYTHFYIYIYIYCARSAACFFSEPWRFLYQVDFCQNLAPWKWSWVIWPLNQA